MQPTRLATLNQQLAAPLLAQRRTYYAGALDLLRTARTARHAFTCQQLVSWRLQELNAALEALGLEPEQGPALRSLDELLATYPLYQLAA